MTTVELHQAQDKEEKASYSLAGKPVAPDNPLAFEKIFKEYYQDLCRYSLRFVKQEEVAEELVQDVFIKLWRKEQQLEIYSSLKAYLYTAVRNSSMNYLKSQFARQRFEEHSPAHHQLQTNSTQESMDYQELSLLVSEAVEGLPEQCRTIFEMSRSGGFSYTEIARELKISPKTVENQIGIALKKLKIHLHKYWDLFLLALILLNETNGII